MSENRAVHASEAQHWYYPVNRALRVCAATPMWEVASSDGKRMLKPNISHARKLGFVPGTTAIIKSAASFGLEKWKRNQVLMAALTATRKPGESDAEFCDRIAEDAAAEAAKAAEAGTEIHAQIQESFSSRTVTAEAKPHVAGVINRLKSEFGPIAWESERPMAHHLGFATKVDLISADGNHLIDFKTKEFDQTESPELYDEHLMQLGAGSMLTQCLSASIMFVSRTHPGLCLLKTVKPEDLGRGRQMFVALLNYWKIKNRYNSGWDIEA